MLGHSAGWGTVGQAQEGQGHSAATGFERMKGRFVRALPKRFLEL